MRTKMLVFISPWLIKRFNGASRIFSVDDMRRFVITPDDICDVFLLPRNNKDVVFYKKGETLDEVIEFKNKVGIDGSSTVGFLKQKLMKDYKEGGDDFKRLFVLYSLSTLLTPSANRTVDVSCFKSLIDVDGIRHFDWCSLVLDRLCRSVDKFNKKSKTHISGCLLALQIIYFHRIKWQGKSEPSELPLVQHWTTEKIRKRAKD
ncbi:hypothetical protein DH2020_000503 [Rehmannia glutinosa]|uniref:Aminotransferase-like plant mobile domain-containing protein n=1 Tax=Rehmannia glutinosa TaxID=99300 RepID=A0ABR0XWT7_REHGL